MNNTDMELRVLYLYVHMYVNIYIYSDIHNNKLCCYGGSFTTFILNAKVVNQSHVN
jgi:hypothetical protein